MFPPKNKILGFRFCKSTHFIISATWTRYPRRIFPNYQEHSNAKCRVKSAICFQTCVGCYRAVLLAQHYSKYSWNTCFNTLVLTYDDVIKWTHFPRYWPFVRGIHRSPVNSPHKGQWRGALMFPLICVWIHGWVNNREAGDLRRYRAH